MIRYASYMAINVEVKRTKSDNNLGLLRKFSRKVKVSGIIKKKKSLRYFERKLSEYRKKMRALMRIKKAEEYKKLEKLGILQYQKGKKKK